MELPDFTFLFPREVEFDGTGGVLQRTTTANGAPGVKSARSGDVAAAAAAEVTGSGGQTGHDESSAGGGVASQRLLLYLPSP